MVPDRHEATAGAFLVGGLAIGVLFVVVALVVAAVVIGAVAILLVWSAAHCLRFTSRPAPWTAWAEAAERSMRGPADR